MWPLVGVPFGPHPFKLPFSFTIGDNIAAAIIDALSLCKLSVIMGTYTYGEKTDANFSTFNELVFIITDKKPFFL